MQNRTFNRGLRALAFATWLRKAERSIPVFLVTTLALLTQLSATASANSNELEATSKYALETAKKYVNDFEDHFPSGSRVYVFDMYKISDNGSFAILPTMTKFMRTATGIIAITPDGEESRFSRDANVELIKSAGETILSGSEQPSALLLGDIQRGHARLNKIIYNSRNVSAPLFGEKCHNGTCPTPEPYPPPEVSGDVTGVSFGPSTGVSFKIPPIFAGNVTATHCFANSKTRVCFYFPNLAPGSTHNVSVYFPGCGQIFESMGIIAPDGQHGGVGSARGGYCH